MKLLLLTCLLFASALAQTESAEDANENFSYEEAAVTNELTDDQKKQIEQDIGNVMHGKQDSETAHSIMKQAFDAMDIDGDGLLTAQEREFLYIDLANDIADKYKDPTSGKITKAMYVDNLVMPKIQKVNEDIEGDDSDSARIMACKLELSLVEEDPEEDWKVLAGLGVDEMEFSAFVNLLLDQMNPDVSQTEQDWYNFVLDDDKPDDRNDHVFHMLEMVGLGQADVVKVSDYTATNNDCSDVSLPARRELFIFTATVLGVLAVSAISAGVQTAASGGDFTDFVVNFGVNVIGNSITVAGCYYTAGLGCAAFGALGGATGNLFGSTMCHARGGEGCFDLGEGDCCYQVSDFAFAAAMGAATAGKTPTKMSDFRKGLPNALGVAVISGAANADYAAVETAFQQWYAGPCIPWSLDACKAATVQSVLEQGGWPYDFVGNYGIKGCYAYYDGPFAGRAFYGWGGSDQQKSASPGTGKFRPLGHDCTTPCLKSSTWCTHSGSTYTFEDCDGDGVPDHVCSDTAGQFGVIRSGSGCSDSWPHGSCSTAEVEELVGEHIPNNQHMAMLDSAVMDISDLETKEAAEEFLEGVMDGVYTKWDIFLYGFAGVGLISLASLLLRNLKSKESWESIPEVAEEEM